MTDAKQQTRLDHYGAAIAFVLLVGFGLTALLAKPPATKVRGIWTAHTELSPERVAWYEEVMARFTTELGVVYKLEGDELHVRPELFKVMPHDVKVGLAMAARETAKAEFVVIVDSTTNKVIARYNPAYGLKMAAE